MMPFLQPNQFFSQLEQICMLSPKSKGMAPFWDSKAAWTEATNEAKATKGYCSYPNTKVLNLLKDSGNKESLLQNTARHVAITYPAG